jgi:NADPH:quinone reductase-like Zn-dependent oxidoreductase
MQAVRVHQHGGPEVLMLEEAPKAAITKADQVLVRMRAAALNHLDLWVRKGLPGIPLPITMGSDGAGVIEEIGKDGGPA